MTDQAMSPLRRRMIEDMTIRKLTPDTQRNYIRTIKNLAAFIGRSPDKASFEDVRRFQLQLTKNGADTSTLNSTVSALRFFFRVTLKRYQIVEHTRFIHEPRKLPVVLSQEEVARLLDAAPGLKYKAALSVAYGAGLRAAEVVSLKLSDIDSKRMVIRVEQGKGRKDRYVMLSPYLLELLRGWWKSAHPQGWLFPGRDRVQPITTRQLNPPKARRACRARRWEVADIFRVHGPAWRKANAGHVSLDQLKVMSAIESCRTAALGGHVARCEKCTHTIIAYNSCRNRHCPKCQGAAAREWLAEREAELLPVPYYHVVFTLPAQIANIAYQNKAVIYHLLFKASSETMLTIAADPKHLGVRIGVLSVLHTWGSALTHHPHVHMIVPGGGISRDASKWVSCRPRFLLPVQVLSRLFRRLLLEKLVAAHRAGELQFFGNHAPLTDRKAFAAFLAPLHKSKWVVYCKRPFSGPKQVLRYLARYTHRVAISNRRLVACDDKGVTFKWKDYRLEGRERYKVMTLATHEFIRRFLMHVLPDGFHRIRHYGLFANGSRADNIARARELLNMRASQKQSADANARNADEPPALAHPCPCCGGRMIVIETFKRGATPRYRPTAPTPIIRIDTS